MAQHLTPLGGFSNRVSRYELALVAIFTCIGIFNVLDFLTTIYALRIGLSEANSLLIGIASATGLSLLGVLASIKIVFIIGSALLVVFGIRSDSGMTKDMILFGIFSFAIVFALVCVNNLYWILT